MRIVVVGAGVVGSHLAERLSAGRHDLSIVDSDPELIRRLAERHDVRAVTGDAVRASVLEQAGVAEADLIIAVTQHDATNLLVSLLASKMGAKKCVVRVRNSELSDPEGVLKLHDVGADFVINSTETTLHLLERLVRNPGATDLSEFADGELALWGFLISKDSPLAGVKLAELRQNYGNIDALIVAIVRDEEIVIPTGNDVLRPGDNIYVFIHRKATGAFRRLVHPEKERIEKLVISGASQLGTELAARLEPRIKSIYLIEPDRERAEAASERLERTTVLCGDIVEHEFIQECNLDDTDYFLALADNDQKNLVDAMIVRKHKVKRIGVLAQNPEFVPVLHQLGINVVVNPRLLVVNAILRHILKGSILQVSTIGETGAEAREYVAHKKSPICGKPIAEVGVPKGAILGAIFRKETFKIPRGDTVIEPGDRVVILARPEAVAGVEKLFAKSRIFPP